MQLGTMSATRTHIRRTPRGKHDTSTFNAFSQRIEMTSLPALRIGRIAFAAGRANYSIDIADNMEPGDISEPRTLGSFVFHPALSFDVIYNSH